MKRHYPLHIHISTLFLLLILLVGGLIGGLGYKLSRDMLESAAEDVTQRMSREILGQIQQIVDPAELVVTLLSHDTLATAATFGERMRRIRFLRQALDNSPALSSLYVGYDDGDFFFMRRVRDDAERVSLGAPERTGFMVQSIERGAGAARGRYLFLDSALRVLREDKRPDYAAAYDPRTRDWFRKALDSGVQIRTPPYLFFSNRKVGMTLATRGREGRSVIGADILLETLGADLAAQKVTPGTQVALVNARGQLIAHENVSLLVTVPDVPDARPQLTELGSVKVPALASLAEPVRRIGQKPSYSARLRVGDEYWHTMIKRVPLEDNEPLYLGIAIPGSELLADATRMRSFSALITALVILFAVPVIWFIARAIARPLRELAGEAESIRHFEFERPVAVRSVIEEVDTLAVTMDGMKRAIRRFLGISEAASAEQDFDRLLPMLLDETLAAADADAGVLYLADGTRLVPATVRRDGGAVTGDLPAVAADQAGPLLGGAIRNATARAGELGGDDIRCLGLEGMVQASTHGVAVPLLNRQQHLVGAIVLLRRTVIEDAQLSFIKALSGSAASSLETRELIKMQKELFEAFIQLIAGAIDAKSPYTGGHCARVPELTKMLARAACAETSGPFGDFSLNEEEWEAVHVAAWLHDCGKVTTPEYVVDKATKLETIHDRIHEVRMRFEVLKRDAEIACLNAIAGGESEAAARARLAAEQARLDTDFAFVAACNEGGEFMAPEKVERLKAIAARTWMRTLDDRLGIAHEEKARKDRVPAPALPVAEALLADKPEHRIERRPAERLADDNQWGFRMTVPELLYNRGELYNLCVARGTLSDEERYKINEHIVQTLIMLSQLPFPRHLRSVPEIAGGHHEKMDGTGYPKRLKRDEMSPVARMMAIADIFEALTAADRPYKKGKKLSEAIRIMSFMRQDRHIDPDLFNLFLRSGVYREYAARFMDPAQIDEVDIAPYLQAV